MKDKCSSFKDIHSCGVRKGILDLVLIFALIHFQYFHKFLPAKSANICLELWYLTTNINTVQLHF